MVLRVRMCFGLYTYYTQIRLYAHMPAEYIHWAQAHMYPGDLNGTLSAPHTRIYLNAFGVVFLAAGSGGARV